MIERGNPLSAVTQVTSQVTKFRDKNSENEQIRTLLDREREQILVDCQAEIRKHEFQADYDRRSTQKFSETIESQQEELYRAQAEERRRQDHQLLGVLLLSPKCARLTSRWSEITNASSNHHLTDRSCLSEVM